MNKVNVARASAARRPTSSTWLDHLAGEDLAFIKRFVLASGSLKDLARVYGVSYPTIRLRLDRLIEKVRLLDRDDITNPFERVLRLQFAEGKIDHQTLTLLLEAHQAALAGAHDPEDGGLP